MDWISGYVDVHLQCPALIPRFVLSLLLQANCGVHGDVCGWNISGFQRLMDDANAWTPCSLSWFTVCSFYRSFAAWSLVFQHTGLTIWCMIPLPYRIEHWLLYSPGVGGHSGVDGMRNKLHSTSLCMVMQRQWGDGGYRVGPDWDCRTMGRDPMWMQCQFMRISEKLIGNLSDGNVSIHF